MAKHFSNEWLLEDLQEEPSFIRKSMFGGLAFYLHGLLVAALMEDPKDTNWQGLLIPTFHEHHPTIQKQFPELTPHPVLKKWLYLKSSSDNFEDTSKKLVLLFLRRDPRFGVPPSDKKGRKSKSKPKTKSKTKANSRARP